MSEDYEFPSPDLIASIQHQGEKLGYLVSQVEEMFANHAKVDHRKATINHSMTGSVYVRKWMSGEMGDQECAELSATLSEQTSTAYDEIKAVHQDNINRLNQMVVQAIEAGKSQQKELNQTLEEILGEN